MFKILIVLWFMRFFINLFTNDMTYKKANEGYLKVLEKHNIRDMNEMDDLNSEDKTSVMAATFGLLFIFIWKILMIILDFIFMLFMIKYDPTIVTKIFLILTVIQIVVAMIRTKFKKNKSDLLESQRKAVYESNRFSIKKLLFRIVNVSYWGYAIYILFF